MRTSAAIVGARARLVKKLILIEGISRAGKFLLGNILNGLKDVEPVQYPPSLEHIPFLYALGFIEKRTAEELLHQEIDIRAYEQLIGRNLNHRIFDKSSILNVADYRSYLARAREADAGKMLKEYWRRGAWSLFLIHEIPDISLFFGTFPGLRVVNISRSPVDLVYEWFTRYDIMGWGMNETFFAIPLKGKRGLLPWFVHARAEEYESLRNPMDRTILIMDVLFAEYQKSLEKLPPAHKKKVLFVSYEELLRDPRRIVARLSRFFGKKPHRDMEKILLREKLPNRAHVEDLKERKLAFIKKQASPLYFKRILALERAYERRAAP